MLFRATHAVRLPWWSFWCSDARSLLHMYRGGRGGGGALEAIQLINYTYFSHFHGFFYYKLREFSFKMKLHMKIFIRINKINSQLALCNECLLCRSYWLYRSACKDSLNILKLDHCSTVTLHDGWNQLLRCHRVFFLSW